jgi:hypothetical protein
MHFAISLYLNDTSIIIFTFGFVEKSQLSLWSEIAKLENPWFIKRINLKDMNKR